MVEGRLTMAEFADRVSAAQAARTVGQLLQLTSDLPLGVAIRRRPTRWLLGLCGSTTRSGLLVVGPRVLCLVACGNIDLDLRQATFSSPALTVLVLGAVGTVDVYLPEGVGLELQSLSLLGHANAHGNDLAPQPGTPLVRVAALGLLAGIDVWRVPLAWAGRSWSQIIRAIRQGEHRELAGGECAPAARPTDG